VGSQYEATTVAAESLAAQLDSQSRLTTPRCENQKIQHENEIVKANEHPSYEWDLPSKAAKAAESYSDTDLGPDPKYLKKKILHISNLF
jgi:hypothetical protein